MLTLAAEREIIKEALYTDPYDQSIWYYHRWLVGSGNPAENGVLVPRDPRQQLLVVDEELANVLELLDLEPEAPCKECGGDRAGLTRAH